MPLTPSTSSPRPKAAPSTTGERESPTPSQLDLLAERNERFAAPSLLRRAAPLFAIGAVALLLGAMLWWVAQRAEPPAKASAASAPAVAPAAAPDAAASRPDIASTAASDLAAPEPRPAAVTAPAAAASAETAQAQASPPARAPVPSATAAERARKAQVRRDADARAKAPRQPREIDLAATPAAAEARGVAGPAAPGAETASRPRAEAAAAGVREFCAARGNIVSQLFCQSRECRKPDRAKDVTCVRLKEIEEAQRRVDAQ